MKLQTCRRHPSAGRFMATCSGCTRELYDMQARNEAMAAARAALAALTGPAVTVTDAKATHTGHLIVAGRSDGAFEFTVDVFRPATAAETNPELEADERRPVGSWVLVDQWGAEDAVEHAQQWEQARDEYAPQISLLAA